MHATGAVLHGHALRHTALPIDFETSEAGQEERDLTVNEMAAIELGGHVHREPQLAPRRLDPARVGNRANEIATQTHECLDGAFQHTGAGLNGIEALFARRLET